MKKILFVLFLMASVNCFAAQPTCNTSSNYCQYTGKVSQLYVNSDNIILIYFDTAVSIEEAAAAGLTINNGSAAAFLISEKPDFAKLFYSTALAAQASNREVTLQMRNTQSGYLKFDRIWLAE